MSWVRVARRDSIPEREGRSVCVRGRELAIFNLGSRFVAMENRCPHMGGPLCDGIVSGTSVVCPLHAWKIDLGSGRVARPPGDGHCVTTYPTRVDGDVVVIDIPEPSENQATQG